MKLGGSYGQAIDEGAHRLARATDADEVARAWSQLAGTLWDLDAHVQDQLTACSDTQACGYQLGRGLAESYWALDPDTAQGWSCWGFLFRSDRCAELVRLTGRLSVYMKPFSAPAIAGSLEVWKELARNKDWRQQSSVHQDLYSQLRTWYELLVLGRDPTGDIRPFQMVRNWRATGRIAINFLPQFLLAAAGLAGVYFFAYLLTTKNGAGAEKAIAGAAATLGLSAAGLTAKVNSGAQALRSRFRQDLYTELIAVAITTAPAPPGKTRKRQAVLQTAIRQRTLTPSTPLDAPSRRLG